MTGLNCIKKGKVKLEEIKTKGQNMEEFKKILVLENEIEAHLLDSILNERGIPHQIRSYYDSAYDGIFQLQKGWGIVLAPEAYKEDIEAIYKDLPLSEKISAENTEEKFNYVPKELSPERI